MIPHKPKTSFDWRIIESPSTRFRLRAMCNELKKKYLGSAWDPYKPQTSELLDKLPGDIFDARTYASWWNGKRYPQSKQIRLIEGLCNGSTHWLDPGTAGSPIFRHLHAIDSATFEHTKKPGAYHATSKERLDKPYEAIHTVWEIFTSDSYWTTKNILDFTQQAPKAKVAHVKEGEYPNINSYVIPSPIRNTYRHDDQKSIFVFLICYLDYSKLTDPYVRDVWILDMASLVLLLGPAMYSSLGFDSQRMLGQLQDMYDMYKCIFYGSDETAGGFFTSLAQEYPGSALDSLYRQLRNRYYELILEIGITKSDMRSILTFEPVNTLDDDITKAGLR